MDVATGIITCLIYSYTDLARAHRGDRRLSKMMQSILNDVIGNYLYAVR